MEQKFAHGGYPVLRWMIDNVFIRTDPVGNIKPDQEKSAEKIDGYCCDNYGTRSCY
jgi:phage terminase large subunit-like protein